MFVDHRFHLGRAVGYQYDIVCEAEVTDFLSVDAYPLSSQSDSDIAYCRAAVNSFGDVESICRTPLSMGIFSLRSNKWMIVEVSEKHCSEVRPGILKPAIL
ncbi:hypothetical protein Y032_0012g1900 [Ancylostoma ceylanicum]|uniref:Uncharacterized protein n=1 Tax=Ancylostoma ceylanicum TaxID=53326 RepID=A0A016VCR6_9BILA|nr:hypothetical protein Y032_0012g1900 [Ancylostoma ceylanicum]